MYDRERNRLTASLLENAHKYVESYHDDHTTPQEAMVNILKGKKHCKHGWFDICGSCMPPKRHWYDRLTRWLAQEVIPRIFDGSKWTIAKPDDDPFNPWEWRLRRKTIIGPFKDYLFPIIRAFYTNSIARDIVSVQPMTDVIPGDLFQVAMVTTAMKMQRGVEDPKLIE